jgi:hypothetical protein
LQFHFPGLNLIARSDISPPQRFGQASNSVVDFSWLRWFSWEQQASVLSKSSLFFMCRTVSSSSTQNWIFLPGALSASKKGFLFVDFVLLGAFSQLVLSRTTQHPCSVRSSQVPVQILIFVAGVLPAH